MEILEWRGFDFERFYSVSYLLNSPNSKITLKYISPLNLRMIVFSTTNRDHIGVPRRSITSDTKRASCSKSASNRKVAPLFQQCQRYPPSLGGSRHIVASALQHRSIAFPHPVYLLHYWYVQLWLRQKDRGFERCCEF